MKKQCHIHAKGFHQEKFFGKASDKNILPMLVCGYIFGSSVTGETMGDEAVKAFFAHVIALSEINKSPDKKRFFSVLSYTCYLWK